VVEERFSVLSLFFYLPKENSRADEQAKKNGAQCAPFSITKAILLFVSVSLVVQTLVSACCVVFSRLNVRTHCVHVVAQLINFSVQSLNVRRQLIDFSVARAASQQSGTQDYRAQYQFSTIHYNTL